MEVCFQILILTRRTFEGIANFLEKKGKCFKKGEFKKDFHELL